MFIKHVPRVEVLETPVRSLMRNLRRSHLKPKKKKENSGHCLRLFEKKVSEKNNAFSREQAEGRLSFLPFFVQTIVYMSLKENIR